MKPFGAIAAVVALCALSLQARPEAGRAAQAQTVKSKAETIVMDVSVLDRKGDPIRGLTVEDFSILEESKAHP